MGLFKAHYARNRTSSRVGPLRVLTPAIPTLCTIQKPWTLRRRASAVARLPACAAWSVNVDAAVPEPLHNSYVSRGPRNGSA